MFLGKTCVTPPESQPRAWFRQCRPNRPWTGVGFKSCVKIMSDLQVSLQSELQESVWRCCAIDKYLQPAHPAIVQHSKATWMQETEKGPGKGKSHTGRTWAGSHSHTGKQGKWWKEIISVLPVPLELKGLDLSLSSVVRVRTHSSASGEEHRNICTGYSENSIFHSPSPAREDLYVLCSTANLNGSPSSWAQFRAALKPFEFPKSLF